MRTKGLDSRQEGNVIFIAPANEIAAREKELLTARKEAQQLSPVRTEYLQVNYAKASDLATLIKSGAGSLISERGSVAIDERTNTLLLQDTSERLADIRRLVSTLDIPVKQVMIEARIVIVSDDYSRDLGVRFGANVAFQQGGSDGLGLLGSPLNSAKTVSASARTRRWAGATTATRRYADRWRRRPARCGFMPARRTRSIVIW